MLRKGDATLESTFRDLKFDSNIFEVAVVENNQITVSFDVKTFRQLTLLKATPTY
jgi:hypothetical protein